MHLRCGLRQLSSLPKRAIQPHANAHVSMMRVASCRSGSVFRPLSPLDAAGSQASGQRCNTTLANAESWLRAKAVASSKRIFLFNLSRQLASLNEALSMEKMYVERVEEVFDSLHSANCHLIVDERSEYHLQAACLVLAAYRVLKDQLNIPAEQVIKILQQCMGDSDSLGERAVRYSLQVCSKLMFKDNYASLKATARQMADADLGKAFDVSHTEAEDQSLHISRVKGCFYNSFFAQHGAPELTAPIFCKAEEALFEKASGLTREELNRGRVTFRLQESLARGDQHCLFKIQRHSEGDLDDGPRAR